ncbi:MAG: hypothetical protein IKK09_01660 [Clostridia bacterium]|nr:hypothetical protein [Clostridia bacterium]
MAFNVQTYTEKFAKELDEQHVKTMVTGYFAGGSFNAEFATSDTVLVAEYDMSGLGDYSREAGYPKGGIAMRKRAYTLPMERGRQFSVDVRDLQTNDLKSGVKELSKVMKTFQKRKVDQEVDAFNLCTIGNSALATNIKPETFTESSTNIVKRLIYDIDKATDAADGEEVIALVNGNIHGHLTASNEFYKYMDVANFAKGKVNTELKTINEAGIVRVDGSRMRTAYNFFNGVDTEEKPGGFAPVKGSGSYNWIILPRSAAQCISVLQRTRVITPEINNDADAYKQGYRRLYGAFVLASDQERIVVSQTA